MFHSPWPHPAVTVDVSLFTVLDTDLKVLLIRRASSPFRAAWSLPGGFLRVGEGLDQGEDLEAAAQRALREGIGLPPENVYLEQLRAFGRPNRDPRGRVITVAWFALLSPDRAGSIAVGADAVEARWWSISERPLLAFDHDDILTTALDRLRGRIEDSSLAFELVPQTFTVGDLRSVHEAIQGTAYDAANFRRRFRRLLEDGLIEPAPGKRQTRSKPASVYRFMRGETG